MELRIQKRLDKILKIFLKTYLYKEIILRDLRKSVLLNDSYNS